MFTPTRPGEVRISSATPMLKDAEEMGVKFAQDHKAASIAELRAKPAGN